MSIYTGEFGRERSQRRLEEDGPYKGKADAFRFYPKIKEHTDRKITVDMNFEDPGKVSIGKKASILVEVLEPNVFRVASNLDQLTKDSFPSGSSKFKNELPPQYENKEQGENFKKGTKEKGDTMMTMQKSNFLVQLV